MIAANPFQHHNFFALGWVFPGSTERDELGGVRQYDQPRSNIR